MNQSLLYPSNAEHQAKNWYHFYKSLVGLDQDPNSQSPAAASGCMVMKRREAAVSKAWRDTGGAQPAAANSSFLPELFAVMKLQDDECDRDYMRTPSSGIWVFQTNRQSLPAVRVELFFILGYFTTASCPCLWRLTAAGVGHCCLRSVTGGAGGFGSGNGPAIPAAPNSARVDRRALCTEDGHQAP